jgi:hypothetical protein
VEQLGPAFIKHDPKSIHLVIHHPNIGVIPNLDYDYRHIGADSEQLGTSFVNFNTQSIYLLICRSNSRILPDLDYHFCRHRDVLAH